MNAFRFRLQQVLEYRRTQLENEEARLQILTAERAELDRIRQAIEESGRLAEMEVRAGRPVSGAELAALSLFREAVRKQEAEIAGRQQKADEVLAAQRAAMLEARRRYRLLERLKEHRHEEWRSANNKELEELAGESYAAQWARTRSGSL
jgi:flagellar export protein FliJ